MDEPPKYTLAEAFEIARAQLKEEPPMLYAPRLDQPPPDSPIVGKPIAEGDVMRQPPHPDQMKLALKPPERCPTRAEQEVFATHWAPIDRNTAAEAEEKAEAARWSLPFPVPENAPLPPDLLLLSDAAKELGYHTPRGFTAFLRRYKYPPQYEIISRRGLAELLRKKADARREYKRNWKNVNPAKAVPEPKKRVPKKNKTAQSEI